MGIIGPTPAMSNIPPRVAFTCQVSRPCIYEPTWVPEYTYPFKPSGVFAIVLQFTGELSINTDSNAHNNITI